jgi:F-type H+-transporting ATPase subunit gamma
MKGVRELKRRTRGVQNIRKITKALELVAGTKLRRLQERAATTRPFAGRLESIMQRVAAMADPEASPLLAVRPAVKDVAVIVIAADKGLCGAYNSNVFRTAVPLLRKLADSGKKCHLYLIGRRIAVYHARIKDPRLVVDFVYPDVVEKITFRRVKSMMAVLVKGYLENRFQEVQLVYTRMTGAASFQPVVQQLIPFQHAETTAAKAAKDQLAKETPAKGDLILEPSPSGIIEALVPRFLEMQLFAAILESLASEFTARRIAMKNATDNADEVISTLIKEYNKARQAGITGELLEITSGADAARGD